LALHPQIACPAAHEQRPTELEWNRPQRGEDNALGKANRQQREEARSQNGRVGGSAGGRSRASADASFVTGSVLHATGGWFDRP
jgi:hypothetical protein